MRGKHYEGETDQGNSVGRQALLEHRNSNRLSPCQSWGLPGNTRGKDSACQWRRCGFNPWVRKIPWRRSWQPTSVFLPGESHGQEPDRLQFIGLQRVGHNWSDLACTHTHTYLKILTFLSLFHGLSTVRYIHKHYWFSTFYNEIMQSLAHKSSQ